MRATAVANKCVDIPDILNHYNFGREGCITNEPFEKNYQNSLKPIIVKCEDFLVDKFGGKLGHKLANIQKFCEKNRLLNKNGRDLKLWIRTWPECHKYIRTMKLLPLRYRYMLWICSKNVFLLKLLFRYLDWRTK